MQVKNLYQDLSGEIMGYDVPMPRKLSRPRPKQGERLIALRKAAQLTQTELAELIGENQANIAYWEQSDKPPRSDVLPRMAEVLGVEVHDLLLMSGPLPKRRGGPVGNVRRLFDEVSQLPRREQSKVVEFVSAFVRQHKNQVG